MTRQVVLQNYDMTLVLDYGHGLIGEDVVNIICEKSKFLAVNTQTNSDNIGYNLITKYPRIDYLCVDEPEFRLATTDRFGEIEDLLITTVKKLNIKKLSQAMGFKNFFYANKVSKLDVLMKKIPRPLSPPVTIPISQQKLVFP